MTFGMIIGFILVPLSWMLIAAANKEHRDSTGVNMPTRGAMRGIRRTARKKGISEEAAYGQWVLRKQKRLVTVANHNSHVQPASVEVSQPTEVARVRAPEHQPFDFEHLQMMARTFGWTICKQAGGLYYIIDSHKKTIENPYVPTTAIRTDFNRRDLEDFLLSC